MRKRVVLGTFRARLSILCQTSRDCDSYQSRYPEEILCIIITWRLLLEPPLYPNQEQNITYEMKNNSFQMHFEILSLIYVNGTDSISCTALQDLKEMTKRQIRR